MSSAKEAVESGTTGIEAGERFAAKLLFQFRVMVDGDPGVMRTCEERIIVFRAATARKALAYAKQRGRSAKRQSRNSDGNPIHFEFVGVLDLMHLGDECDADEVWYDITTRKLPMERAADLIPPDHKLSAIRLGI
ncbi:DUF4288 domain-containing protein [Lysobacter sp. Root604]|uniref:DUF4288 domain-containing protein n=1 Tax=Lysobacter sp. Root604 TaxID=1736568 RepID=UPI0006FE372D|nr:DUF4288 domain-containing protein [Lysobacter sp. Root604]KRA17103.1 hypothetical protein ASD69_10260 [Lysobacter sp. Root604]